MEMEKGSDKHGPLQDEQIARQTQGLESAEPTESRADEFREEEPPERVEPTKEEIARHLEPSTFPADRTGILASAEAQNAPEEVLIALRFLPEGVTFNDVSEVWDAVRKGRDEEGLG